MIQPPILITVSDFPKVTETFVLANALHYQKMGHPVSIFHLKPFRQGEVIHSNAQSVIEKGFTFGWLGRESLAGLVWAARRPSKFCGILARIFGAFWKEPKRLAAGLSIFPKSCAMAKWAQANDVAHIHAEFAGYPATSAWIAAELTGIPFSYSAHAHDIFLTQNLLIEKARKARFVRVISAFNERFLSALNGFPKDKLRVLRCGVTLGETAPLPAFPDQSNPLKILFVGALLPRKGVDLLIRAIAGIPTGVAWTLDVIGGGKELGKLQAMVAEHDLKNVTFHGPKMSQEVHDAMRDAHLVVVPSRETSEGRSEGIPVVLMEALSLSRPVISTRLSGIPELVEDGVTGLLIDPDDCAGLTTAITRVAQNYSSAAALGAAGRARIQQDYDIQKTAEQLRQAIVEEV